MRFSMPLQGIKVLDFTIAMAGPLAAQRLGDMGAEVIKVESFAGDLTRVFTLQDLNLGEDTTSYLALNRNKRSIAIDLKRAEGKEIVLALAREVDIVLQNFRPGVAERLGIAYEQVREVNPRIVYTSISGYGETGPLCDAPGQDLLAQGFSGLTFSAGVRDGMPHPAPTYFVDTCASHLATEGVLAALVQRSVTGEGQHVKTNLLSAALEAQSQEVMTCMLTGVAARRTRAPYASAWLEPPYGIYRTRDSWLALPQNDMHVVGRVVGSQALVEHVESRPDRFDREASDEWRSVCYELLAQALLTRTTNEWIALMTPERIWCGVVQDMTAMLAHDQSRHHLSAFEHARHGRVPCVAPAVTFSAMSEPPMKPPPGLGEHTDEILREAGYSAGRVATLLEQGVVK